MAKQWETSFDYLVNNVASLLKKPHSHTKRILLSFSIKLDFESSRSHFGQFLISNKATSL
jgi:hypothetical protein